QVQVLSPFLFTLYTSDFTYNTDHCHIQKFSDHTAIIRHVSDGNELEYRGIIKDFVDWCGMNHRHINASKTKEMVIDFRRKSLPTTPVNIQGLDIETVESYIYLGVHLNNKLDWSVNTDVLYKRGQSRLHLLRTLLKTFYDTVVASAIFYAVVCCGGGCTDRDRTRVNKLVRRASSVLIHPHCKKECYRRSFIPTAVRLFSDTTT
ncbi:hypothetical protein LDENG_00051090, partial [Lucifuga dentata]